MSSTNETGPVVLTPTQVVNQFAPYPIYGTRLPKLSYLPPQVDRHHYVFLKACGCPFGLTEASARKPGGPPRLADENAAWDDFYTRDEERVARARGVTVVHADHATYEREYHDRMLTRCPHGGAR